VGARTVERKRKRRKKKKVRVTTWSRHVDNSKVLYS
jgi:hypothetical protein